MTDAHPPTAEQVIHAAADAGPRPNFLCGGVTGRTTRPTEYPTCSECMEVLKFTTGQYPERFGFVDIRMTASQRRQAAADMRADMYGGADD
jgi:hypothetical protein